jgi:hypothetical protein
LKKNEQAQWLFCNRRGASEAPLSCAAFGLCLALRCYALPRRFSFHSVDYEGKPRNAPYRCEHCALRIGDDQTYIDHLFSCKAGVEYLATGARHNWLKYAIAATIAHHGISCTVEPRLLTPFYAHANLDERVDHRPDLLCRTVDPIVTDFGIVMQGKQLSVGDEARSYASQKHRLHHKACERAGFKYSSFVVETFGHVDSDAQRFIDHVIRHVPSVSRRALDFELKFVTSVVLAKIRADMIVADQASRNIVALC